MQNFSQIDEVPWPRHFNITRILQSTTLNMSVQKGIFPSKLKEAKVIPVYKSDDEKVIIDQYHYSPFLIGYLRN